MKNLIIFLNKNSSKCFRLGVKLAGTRVFLFSFTQKRRFCYCSLLDNTDSNWVKWKRLDQLCTYLVNSSISDARLPETSLHSGTNQSSNLRIPSAIKNFGRSLIVCSIFLILKRGVPKINIYLLPWQLQLHFELLQNNKQGWYRKKLFSQFWFETIAVKTKCEITSPQLSHIPSSYKHGLLLLTTIFLDFFIPWNTEFLGIFGV